MMGKSKKRNLTRENGSEEYALTREEAAKRIAAAIKNKGADNDTVRLICLFGITAEELACAGACYEEISAVKHLLV